MEIALEQGTPNLDNRLHIIGKLKVRGQLPGILTGLTGLPGFCHYEFMIFGASTNGKSGDFGSPMWWFESTRPSQGKTWSDGIRPGEMEWWSYGVSEKG